MSLEDPFFVVKGEVQKAVNTAHGLYNRWCQLLEESHIISKEEFDWTTNELRNSLRSIDWDLEDLEETICIVESNPHKFRIELSEVATRRSFITEMRESVKEMRDHIASPAAQALINRKNREALMGDRDHFELLGVEKLPTPNSHTLEQQQLHQKNARRLCPRDGRYSQPHGRSVKEDDQSLPRGQWTASVVHHWPVARHCCGGTDSALCSLIKWQNRWRERSGMPFLAKWNVRNHCRYSLGSCTGEE
uniref:Syntaxin-10 isoform X1 n=1 Tax=Pogona vitticeps TaxID=103695 RepID=A0ABM5FLX7_9SAUR